MWQPNNEWRPLLSFVIVVYVQTMVSVPPVFIPPSHACANSLHRNRTMSMWQQCGMTTTWRWQCRTTTQEWVDDLEQCHNDHMQQQHAMMMWPGAVVMRQQWHTAMTQWQHATMTCNNDMAGTEGNKATMACDKTQWQHTMSTWDNNGWQPNTTLKWQQGSTVPLTACPSPFPSIPFPSISLLFNPPSP